MNGVIPPRTLADGNIKLTVLEDFAESLVGIPESVLNEGTEATCRVLKSVHRLSATDSQTFAEDAALCEEGAPSSLGHSQYEGRTGVFRFFDPEDLAKADPEADALFQTLKHKNTEVVFVERSSGKKWSDPWEAGDEYDAYRVQVDNWQKPSDQTQGFIKREIPLSVQSAELNGTVAASSGGGGGG